MKPIGREFFQRDPETCARELIGKVFRWNDCSGIIVETEAYAEHGDEACHTFVRPSARDFVTANPAGTAYVYLNYGMYWLSNVLVKDGSSNGFVLIRALEPLEGIPKMQNRRNKDRPRDLCSGPGKLSMALGIKGDDHGRSLVRSTKRGFFIPDTQPLEVEVDVRIGISKAADLPWRFLAKGSPFVSVAPKG
ncbi:MAG: DNA-3-methyladenine glycosylase [Verrucomicrobiota bacterium]